jgi:hypothetical protein
MRYFLVLISVAVVLFVAPAMAHSSTSDAEEPPRSAAGLAASPRKSKCAHGTLDKLPGYGLNAAFTDAEEATVGEHRFQAQQSGSTPPTTGVPLEITFVESLGTCEDDDGSSSGTNDCGVCTSTGQEVATFTDSSTETCTSLDIMTTEKFAYARKVRERVSEFFRNNLNVGVVTGSTIPTTYKTCGTFVKVPAAYSGADVTSKLVVLVTYAPHDGSVHEDVFLYSSACLKHAVTLRALVAHLNIIPAHLSNADKSTLGYRNGLAFENDVDAMIHEVTHLLGFNSNAFFRGYVNAAGTAFQTSPVATTSRYASPLGRTAYYVTSPRVVAAAKDYFGCSSLTGVELEDTDRNVAMHWESRTLMDDLMTYERTSVRRFHSAMTFAFLLDTGLYLAPTPSVNTTWSLTANRNLHGRGKGCSFAADACNWNKTYGLAYSDYCFPTTLNSGDSCTADRRGRGYCNVMEHASWPPYSKRYFNYPQDKWGGSEAMDYCPIIVPYANKVCTDASNRDVYNVYGNAYGDNSRCFTSNIAANGFDGTTLNTRCFKVNCGASKSDGYTVTVGAGLATLRCEAGMATVSAGASTDHLTGTVTCAPYDEVCPTLDASMQAPYSWAALETSDDLIETPPVVHTAFTEGVACEDRFASCFLPAVDLHWPAGRCSEITRAWSTCFASDCPHVARDLVTLSTRDVIDSAGRTRRLSLFRANCSGSLADLKAACSNTLMTELHEYCSLATLPSSAPALGLTMIIAVAATAVFLGAFA